MSTSDNSVPVPSVVHTTVGPAPAGYSTPVAAAAGVGSTVKDLFESAQVLYLLGPGIDEVPLSAMADHVNKLLKPINKTWDDLNRFDRTKMCFVVIKKLDKSHLHRCQKKAEVEFAGMLGDAMNETTAICCRLNALLQKGGDRPLGQPEDMMMHNALPDFLLRFPIWNDPELAPTIFNNLSELERLDPLYRFQADTFPLCYFVALSNLVYYSACKHGGLIPAQAIQTVTLNINRFMRRQFDADLVYDNVFLGLGGWPEDLLLKLLQPQNPCRCPLIFIEIDKGNGVEFSFQDFRFAIRRYGALLVESFKISDAMVSRNGVIQFNGDSVDDESTHGFHAILVVGVRMTESVKRMGGLEFLVQNSWRHKPFITIGYDLLKAMKVTRFLAINPGLRFDAHADSFDISTRSILTGSGASEVGKDELTFDSSLSEERFSSVREFLG